MQIVTYIGSTHMTSWNRNEHIDDIISLILSPDRENLILDLFRKDSEVPFYMTFEEATRVAHELKMFVDKYGT